MRLRRVLAIGSAMLLALSALIYLLNAPWLAPRMDGTPRILAHRGVHQDFDRTNLKNACRDEHEDEHPDAAGPKPQLRPSHYLTSTPIYGAGRQS